MKRRGRAKVGEDEHHGSGDPGGASRHKGVAWANGRRSARGVEGEKETWIFWGGRFLFLFFDDFAKKWCLFVLFFSPCWKRTKNWIAIYETYVGQSEKLEQSVRASRLLRVEQAQSITPRASRSFFPYFFGIAGWSACCAVQRRRTAAGVATRFAPSMEESDDDTVCLGDSFFVNREYCSFHTCLFLHLFFCLVTHKPFFLALVQLWTHHLHFRASFSSSAMSSLRFQYVPPFFSFVISFDCDFGRWIRSFSLIFLNPTRMKIKTK